MALFLPRRWRRQPTARVTASTLGADANVLLSCAQSSRYVFDNLGTKQFCTPTLTGNADFGYTSHGRWAGEVGGTIVGKIDLGSTAATQITVSSGLVVFQCNPAAADFHPLYVSSIPFSEGISFTRYNDTTFGGKIYCDKKDIAGIGNTSNAASANTLNCLAWSYSEATGALVLALNGVVSTATSVQTITHGNAAIGQYDNVGSHIHSNEFYAFALWPTIKGEAFLRDLTVNPWQLFTPQRNVLYFLGTAGVNQSVDVPLATIVVAGHAPTANRTQSAIVPAAAITVNAHAPTINQTRAVDVPAANIVVAAHAPTVNRTQSVAVPAANIAVNAYAPTIGQGQSIAVPAANIAVAAHAPTINRTQSVSVPVAEIIVNGYAPTVVNSGILPAAALAELYGGNIFTGKKKKKKKEDKPKLEEMVFAVAKTPDGKKAIIGALPKSIQDELPDPQLALVSDLVRKIEDASAKVQKEVERIYKKRRDDDDEDDVFILLM